MCRSPFRAGRKRGREDDRALASAAFDRVFQTSPNETDIYHGRGTLAVLDGDYERALAEYNYAISLSTKSALCFAQRGEIFRALGQAQLASQDYDTAIALDPEHDDAYLYRSMLHYNQGDLASATADWNVHTPAGHRAHWCIASSGYSATSPAT